MKLMLLIFAVLSLSNSAFAAQQPVAGSQLQQIPPPPAVQRKLPETRVDQGATTTIPVTDHVNFPVTSLHVTGQTLYSEAGLIAVTNFKPGSELNLTALRAMAVRIADFYHHNGYFLTQAYLPSQEIRDGVVNIAVIEGRYGAVTLNNQANLSDSQANGMLDGLHSGDVIATAPLERRLLILSDIPGVRVKSTLIPGASLGTSDLIVDVTQGERVTGEVDADNAGNRYTGEYRLGATVNYNEPLGIGDVASLRAMTSGFGLFYVRASYQLLVGKATVGAAYSFLQYRLLKEFEPLNANGTAHILSLYGSYPLIRTRSGNLYAGLALDYKMFQDRVDVTATVTDKQAQVLMPSLYGDFRDSLLGGAESSGSLTWYFGNLDIQTASARAIDAATARSNGLYNKLKYSATRLQNVAGPVSLYAAINGQVALKNLDVSEKMELGGMYAVRAYPEGEAYADEGYVVNLEARLLLPKFAERLPGRMHLIGFFDTGTVTVNHTPWTGGPNSRTLSGAGVGLTWMEYNNFSVKAYYAFKLGNETATSAPDADGRFWIQLVKYF